MISRADAEARVARGAAHLDTVRPGWEKLIDVGTLSIGSCVDCILGQIFRREADDANRNPFGYGLSAVGWWDDGEAHGVAGFLLGQDMKVTQDAWIAAIAARLHPEVSDPVPSVPVAQGAGQ